MERGAAGLDQDFLIGHVTWRDDDRGRRTEMLVAPPSAFSPGLLKVKHGAGGNPWAASFRRSRSRCRRCVPPFLLLRRLLDREGGSRRSASIALTWLSILVPSPRA